MVNEARRQRLETRCLRAGAKLRQASAPLPLIPKLLTRAHANREPATQSLHQSAAITFPFSLSFSFSIVFSIPREQQGCIA